MSAFTLRKRLATHGPKRGNSAFYQVIELKNPEGKGFVLTHYGKNSAMTGAYIPSSGGNTELHVMRGAGVISLEDSVSKKNGDYTFGPTTVERFNADQAKSWMTQNLPTKHMADAEKALFGGFLVAASTVSKPAPEPETVKHDEPTPDFYGDW